MQDSNTQGSGGHVTVNERIPSQRFHRFVDTKMRDWLRDHDLTEENTEYEVAFFDEEPLGETSCLVVVQSGPKMWRAWQSADNPRQALRESIERLRMDDEPEAPATTH